MKRFMNKKVAAIGLASALALGAAGIAAAYWTSGGSGDGSGSVGSTTNWTVTVSSDTTTSLTPGSGTEVLTYTVTNNDKGSEMLHQVAFTVANASTPFSIDTNSSDPACTDADFDLTASSVSDPGAGNALTVPINQELTGNPSSGDVYTGTITLAMVDRHDTVAGDNSGNQDNCENATVPVHAVAS